MDKDENPSRPAKAAEHGAVRKHDQLTVTDETDPTPLDTYFNKDGIKVKDVDFVGERSPDADPDDRGLQPVADPEPEQLKAADTPR